MLLRDSTFVETSLLDRSTGPSMDWDFAQGSGQRGPIKYNYDDIGTLSALAVVGPHMPPFDDLDIDSVVVPPVHCHRCGAAVGTTEFEGFEVGFYPPRGGQRPRVPDPGFRSRADRDGSRGE